MSILVSIKSLSKAFGSEPLFENLECQIFKNNKIGIVGPNGAGKSTLLKLILDEIPLDTGEIVKKKHLNIVSITQNIPFQLGLDIQTSLSSYLTDINVDKDRQDLIITKAISLSKIESIPEKISDLSGGQQKRLAISLAISLEPDLLLLDEPTNHLDLTGVIWLESILKTCSCAFLMVSHDRYFLNKTVENIWEINSIYENGIFPVNGNFDKFVVEKSNFLIAEQNKLESLSNIVKREKQWLNAGVKARTTKSRYRIESAFELINQLSQMKNRLNTEKAQLDFKGSDRKTKNLVTLESLSQSYDDHQVISELSISIKKGDKIGIIGPNGCGKSTILKIIANIIPVQSGTKSEAKDLIITYFDQFKSSINENNTVIEELSGGDEKLIVMGESVHVISYAKRFLFTKEQLDYRVSTLSGGEKARLIAAKLIKEKADLLILDEPTNDLDIDTLEMLEACLESYGGSLVIVSHDRYFLEKICNKYLGYQENGKFIDFGSFQQWESQFKNGLSPKPKKQGKDKRKNTPKKSKPKKMSFNEKREFEGMEKTIAEAEGKVSVLEEKIATLDPSNSPKEYNDLFINLKKAQDEVQHLFDRWAYLEELSD